MQYISDYRVEFEELFNKVLLDMNKYGFCPQKDQLKTEIDDRLQKAHPSIMFYGIYNAGKSSIINAIFGEKIAEVGDVPTTAEIQKIEWGGFELVDTPGIDANDEHTQIAKNQILRNDVILFVIDDMGSFEKAVVYRAIIEIVKLRKPIIVVINQKQAEDGPIEEQESIKKIRNRIIENIRREAANNGIKNILDEENLYVIAVNAESAYTAKQTNSQYSIQLLEESGIDVLEITMERELKKTDGIKMLIPAIDLVLDSIGECKTAIEEKIKNEAGKALYKSIESIKTQKNVTYKSLINKGKAEIMAFSDKMSAYALAGNSVESVANELNERLKEIVNETIKDSKIDIETTFNVYCADLKETISKNKMPDIDIEINDTFSDNTNSSLIDDVDKILEVLEKIPVITVPTVPLPNIPISIIRKLLGLFKTKKSAEKDINSMQEKVNEYNSRVMSEIDKRVSAVYEINNKIRTEMYKVETSFNEKVEDLVNTIYDGLITEIETKLSTENEEEEKNKEALIAFNNNIEALEKIKVSIG